MSSSLIPSNSPTLSPVVIIMATAKDLYDGCRNDSLTILDASIFEKARFLVCFVFAFHRCFLYTENYIKIKNFKIS